MSSFDIEWTGPESPRRAEKVIGYLHLAVVGSERKKNAPDDLVGGVFALGNVIRRVLRCRNRGGTCGPSRVLRELLRANRASMESSRLLPLRARKCPCQAACRDRSCF